MIKLIASVFWLGDDVGCVEQQSSIYFRESTLTRGSFAVRIDLNNKSMFSIIKERS